MPRTTMPRRSGGAPRAAQPSAARVRRAGAVAAVAALALSACSAIDASDDPSTPSDTVTLVTHDSFALADGLIESFEQESGLRVEIVTPGDGGSLVNQLVLTKDAPLGDAVFGIDNSFASRAIDAGVLDPYTSQAPAAADAEQYAPDGSGSLTAIDVGDVCVNVDDAWFAERGLAAPATLEDLARPEYRDQLVVTNAATSSPGLAFLLATVGAFGEDGWQGYWQRLQANGVKVVESWSDAYDVDFSGGSGQGERPLVLSYASSPPFTVPEGGSEPPTSALLDTCFRQVEYAGVLSGAANPDGAAQLLDFLLSDEVQADIPVSMYMYPVSSAVELPDEWTRWAPLADAPFDVAPADVATHRERWLTQWSDTVIG